MEFDADLIEYTAPPSSEVYCSYVDALCTRHPSLRVDLLGKTVLGRDIPMFTLGRGARKLLYVGAHHGSEWLTGLLLLRFIDDFCTSARTAHSAYGISLDYLLSTRSLSVVPVLNIDGVDLAVHDGELTHWQANARGVDLNHNYDYRFAEYKALEAELGCDVPCATRYSGEYPESEPESAALACLIRGGDIGIILSLHSQGEVIYTHTRGRVGERCEAIGKTLSRMTGYTLGCADGAAAYGGLTDYACEYLGIPSFTIECGKGENPLPLDDMYSIYPRLRRTLFTCSVLR